MKIENITRSMFAKVVSAINIIAIVLLMSPFHYATAASLTAISDTMSREKASTASTHKIVFTSTSAIAAGNTIAVAFPSGFTTTGLVITDLQICHGVSTGLEHGTAAVTGTSCTATDETIAASNGASTIWGAVISGTTTITLTAPSGTFTNTISAGHKVTIFITATHMVNPTVSTPTVTITTTSDSGSYVVPIADDDQVNVSATVGSTISFDLDTYATATTSTETATPYTVALGALTTAAASGSNESSVNAIWFDLNTNASGGATVSVLSANGALKSTSTPADTIPSATATMTAGTANYGLCEKRNDKTSGTFNKVSPFDGATCSTTPTGNTVGAVTTTAQTMYNTAGAPIVGARAEIMVNAENSTSTQAHSDYADTLTFIATATF